MAKGMRRAGPQPCTSRARRFPGVTFRQATVQEELQSCAGGWIAEAQCTNHCPQAALPMTYAVFGDQGDYNGQTLPSLQMAARNGELDMVLHVGDMAYDFDSDNGRTGLELAS